MSKYHFIIDVEMDAENESLMWDAEDEAPEMGAWPANVCAASFARTYLLDYGVVMVVTRCAFTGDEDNR